MAMRQLFQWKGTVTATEDVPLTVDPMDWSRCNSLYAQLLLTGNAGGAAGDTLNGYVMNRWQDGPFEDRAAFNQIIGTALAANYAEPTLQIQAGNSDYIGTERARVAYGVNDVNHLPAGQTLDGPFPPLIRRGYVAPNYSGNMPLQNMPLAPWKVRFVVVNAVAPSFPVEVTLWGDFGEWRS